MSFLRLGNLSSLLSDPLINGFTTGAAVHVTVSQLKDLFGIKIPRHKGVFKTIYVSENGFDLKFGHFQKCNLLLLSFVDGERLYKSNTKFKCIHCYYIIVGDYFYDDNE